MPFSDQDQEDLEHRGISRGEIERQLTLLRTPPERVSLAQACTLGEGISSLEGREDLLEETWRRGSGAIDWLKFVPASGAASRMFSFARRALAVLGQPTRSELAAVGIEQEEAARDVLDLLDRLEQTPYRELLAGWAREQGDELERLKEDRPLELIAALVDSNGLDLSSVPKGLIPFHQYPDGPRAGFGEQCHETALYSSNSGRPVRLHFTVAKQHLPAFEAAAIEAQTELRDSHSSQLEVDFSLQDTSSDTICLAPNGEPLRTQATGRLEFRPAGHGALILNLGQIDADIVFIKNIDNIARAERHPLTAAWKRRLAGHLLELRQQTWSLLDRLEDGDRRAVADTLEFLDHQLALRLPERLRAAPSDELRDSLIDRLDRPLRVCGVVTNVGEPGGGPFWVRDRDGVLAGQIVEAGQIDFDSPDQAQIVEGATHFNPVDLVCSWRDRAGDRYDLSRFVDAGTSFVSDKPFEGSTVRVLERPGLWNGAMAGWNTAFVEVPLATFTPVKSLLDLIRPDHLPAAP